MKKKGWYLLTQKCQLEACCGKSRGVLLPVKLIKIEILISKKEFLEKKFKSQY